MTLARASIDRSRFHAAAALPFQPGLADFEIAVQDVCDFCFDANKLPLDRGPRRLDGYAPARRMSGMISDMLTAPMAKHARLLVENRHCNGHPDLVANKSVKGGTNGVEIRSTAPHERQAKRCLSRRGRAYCGSRATRPI